MCVSKTSYGAYLDEIDRYLTDSRAFAAEIKDLEREKSKERAASSRRLEQERRGLELRVQDAVRSYEQTARTLSAEGLREVGALIPVKVRPARGPDTLDDLLAKHVEITRKIEVLIRQYVREKEGEGTSERRAAEALEARRRVLQDRLAQEEEPNDELAPPRASGCLSHVAAVLLLGLVFFGCLLPSMV